MPNSLSGYFRNDTNRATRCCCQRRLVRFPIRLRGEDRSDGPASESCQDSPQLWAKMCGHSMPTSWSLKDGISCSNEGYGVPCCQVAIANRFLVALALESLSFQRILESLFASITRAVAEVHLSSSRLFAWPTAMSHKGSFAWMARGRWASRYGRGLDDSGQGDVG